jgi:hypothetical protein
MTRQHLRLLPFLFSALSGLAPAAQAQDPACDDFERASIGSDWTQLSPVNSDIVNSSDLGSPDSGSCTVSWAASAFGADQWSHVVTSRDKPANVLTQVFVRRRPSDNARYGFHWNGDPGRSEWQIKYDGVPTAQTRIVASFVSPGPAPGDSLCLEVEGQTLRGYWNGVMVLSANDTAPDAIVGAGPLGVVARPAQTTTVTPPTAIFESWRGGTFVPGGGCAQAAVTLFAVKRGADVGLEWTAGAPPHVLERAVALPTVWDPLASCVPGASWSDAAVVPDGRFLLYRVRA